MLKPKKIKQVSAINAQKKKNLWKFNLEVKKIFKNNKGIILLGDSYPKNMT